MYSIKYLLENSNLPGPRGNLELLYAFSKNADLKIADKCLSFIKEETKNSPEEFVGMCGILSFSILNDKKINMSWDSSENMLLTAVGEYENL